MKAPASRYVLRLALAALCAAPPLAVAALAPDQLARALLNLSAPRPALALAQAPALRGEALYRLQHWREAAAVYTALGAAQAYNRANALAQAGEFAAAITAYDQALAAEPGEEDASFNRALVTEALYRQKLAAAGAGAGAANAAASLRAKGQLDRMTPNDNPSGTGDGMAAGKESPSLAGAEGSGSAAGQGAGRESQDSGDGMAHGAASDAGGPGRKGGGADSIDEAFRRNQRKVTRSLEAQWIQPSATWLAAIADDQRKYLKTRLIAEKKQRLRASIDVKSPTP